MLWCASHFGLSPHPEAHMDVVTGPAYRKSATGHDYLQEMATI